ncbi:hypothetical protein ROHU_022751 [Labeo rohita]|uniref:Uncharacterized protein n=1 Tax=Labeo rohita TaxID=84645 RepID=A0A498LXB3_LABRO|nr:hypothetical protein ROHU_029334 [Labeo rohita]RXN23345.1 hypothetical protein ROHU_022751 [Labeo rohita]
MRLIVMSVLVKHDSFEIKVRTSICFVLPRTAETVPGSVTGKAGLGDGCVKKAYFVDVSHLRIPDSAKWGSGPTEVDIT